MHISQETRDNAETNRIVVARAEPMLAQPLEERHPAVSDELLQAIVRRLTPLTDPERLQEWKDHDHTHEVERLRGTYKAIHGEEN